MHRTVRFLNQNDHGYYAEYRKLYARLSPRVKKRLEHKFEASLIVASPLTKPLIRIQLAFQTFRIARSVTRKKLRWMIDPYILRWS